MKQPIIYSALLHPHKKFILPTRPCFARASTTVFDSLHLWIMRACSLEWRELRMKFNIKLRFQGPPWFELHHFTVLTESDSKMSEWELINGLDREILTARKMAKISAELISIGGIGHGKTHKNIPWSFLKTPPIALWWRIGSREASMFHLYPKDGEGLQFQLGFMRGMTLPSCGFDTHLRHSGFRTISSEE